MFQQLNPKITLARIFLCVGFGLKHFLPLHLLIQENPKGNHFFWKIIEIIF